LPNARNDLIGRITTDGIITGFGDPAGHIHGTVGITTGPDGNLWFTSPTATGRIGRITTDGIITTFLDPACDLACPDEITTGPDGNLWFTSEQTHGSAGAPPTGSSPRSPTPQASCRALSGSRPGLTATCGSRAT
jgi:sugar lactone lactonase YvrE